MPLKSFNLSSKNIYLGFVAWICILYYLDAYSSAKAQVTEDGTTSTEVTTENERNFTVNSGEQRGNNLFHSFNEFSIPNNGSVSFNNAVTIQNIITRVTGSSISEIRGLIQSNGMANLFLINPNGIIFGENATLNIGGSFVGTTAESLLFADGTEFSTNLDSSQSSLLTVSVPLGLQFGSNSGEIINRANLLGPDPVDPSLEQIKLGLSTPGKTLALLGNGVTFDGGAATASRGNIQLGSVDENSFVALESIATGWKANYDNVSQFQDLKFDNLASVNTSGLGSGNINITGKNIKILNGSAISSNTSGNIDGGIIEIRASDLLEINGSDITDTKLDPLLADNVEIFLPFASQISSSTLGSGKGGDIDITTQNLKLVDGGAIELQTFPGSSGDGGNLSITVNASIELNGIRRLIGTGDKAESFDFPGELTLDEAIDLNQSSEISTASIGNGNAGNINILSENIRLENGAIIGVSPFGSGDGGNININANETIEILGSSTRTGSTSSQIAANTFADGNAGNLDISTEKLSIRDGGLLISTTSTQGNAGNIRIETSTTEIDGFRAQDEVSSSISARTRGGGGEGGDISLNTDRLIISNEGTLSVEGERQSVPGNLIVNADTIELNNSASITAETEFESGGIIELNVKDNLFLRDNSQISAQASNNARGGNLSIDANFIVAFPQQDNDILANAEFGNGGNITVTAEGILGLEERPSQPPNQTNDIDASSEFGDAGTVELEFPDGNSDNTLARLDSDYVDVEELFRNTFCKVRDNNRFVATGRGGIPQIPDRLLLPEHTWTDWRIVGDNQNTEVERKEEESAPKQITMVQGWIKDSSGNVVLTDKPITVASQAPGLKTPDCNDANNQ